MTDLTQALLAALGRRARHGADLTQAELIDSVKPQLAALFAVLEAAAIEALERA